MLERRRRGRLRPPATPVILIFILFGIINISSLAATVMGEECDWAGSGLHPGDTSTRGVTPVYLRCSQGRVSWSYPGGALRVLLRLGSSGREFRGCIKSSPEFAGARVFLEGPRSLSRLLDTEDGAPKQLVRCFHSRGGQAALYVEAATATSTFPRQVAEFSYDLEPLPRNGGSYDPAEECRPCSKEEMTHAYCTSDLVTRGIIRSIEKRSEIEMSEVTVKVTKHLRHSSSGVGGEDDFDSEEYTENSVVGSNSKKNTNNEDGVVYLHVPIHCGARHGDGEFVFMARRKLGELALTCAPRLEDWADIVRTENHNGSAHCVLKS